MDQAATITPLVKDVYVLSSPFYQSKRTLIVDDGGSTLIDTPLAFAETQMLLSVAEAKSQPVRRIVLTHSHFDHSAGCQLLPLAERIAQQGAGEWMVSQHAANYLARRPPQHPDLVNIRITLPSLELRGAATLRLGQRTLHLIPTPGHSPDSMSMLLEPDGVLFTGDGLITCFPPVISDGDSTEAMATFRHILTLTFKYVVPGHGPVLEASAARQHCQSSLNYLEEIKTRLAHLDPDAPLQDAYGAVADLLGMFPFPRDVSEGWHQGAVRKIWQEQHRSVGDRSAR